MKVPKFHYRPDLNELELDSDPGPLRPDQPTLPGFDNLPVTKPNKKPIHEQLEDLKNEHQNPYIKAAQQNTKKELSSGGYVDKEQRIYESLKVPGYETYEKSDASYKKLKENENNIAYNSTTGKIFDAWKNEPNVRIPQKDLVNRLQKDKDLENVKLPVGLGNRSMKSDPRTSNQKKFDKYNIAQRLKNARGPSSWDLIKQVATRPEDKKDIRDIINKEYKRNGMQNLSKDEIKYVDKSLIKPVKIFDSLDPNSFPSDETQRRALLTPEKFTKPPQYPEVILGSPAEVSQTTINKDERPVEQIVQELADKRLVHEQRDWDHRYGKGGITSLKRPE